MRFQLAAEATGGQTRGAMLYARWQQVASDRAAETALVDVATGRRWTFAELAEAGHRHPAHPGPVCAASAAGTGFVLEVLAAWREGRVLCPLEPGQEPPREPADFPSDVVHLKRTSGSTGQPRWVLFTADQLAADVRHIVDGMGLRPDWPNLGVISLAHSYGFSNLVLPLLLFGVPLHLAPFPLPEAVRQAAGTMGGLTLPAVPAMWRTWHATRSVPPNTRLAISAGAPLPAELEQAVHRDTGIKIHNFYGATECGGIAYDASAAPRTDPTLVGTPLGGVGVAVDADGLLTVRGPSVGLGIWPDPDPRLVDGVFRPGDLARVGPDGIRLLGRSGDTLNVAGRKLAPETVEHALRQHPAVGECLVVGLPASDPGRGDTVAAVVALREEASVADLRAFLLARLPAWQVPRRWRIEPGLAPDRRGKLSRAAWRGILAAGEA